MDKIKALGLINQIESTFDESEKGFDNKEIVNELKKNFYKLKIECSGEVYLQEKITSAEGQLDIVFSQRKHQKFPNGIDGAVHYFNVDISALKSWVNRKV